MVQREPSAEGLSAQQKRLITVERWLFRACILSVVLLGYLTLYFGETSPTVRDLGSGAINPFYDKVHGNYVYLTARENNSLALVFFTGIASFLLAIFINFKLKSSVARSELDRAGER